MCKKGNLIRTEYGYCNYCICDNCSMLYNLYVEPEHRRKGNAKHLIQTAIDAIRATGYVKDINVEAKPQEGSIGTEKLIEFYIKMGLKVI